MKKIEYPVGSGRWATYSADEQDYVRAVAAAAQDQGRSRQQVADELGVLHDLKVEFGIDLVQGTTD